MHSVFLCIWIFSLESLLGVNYKNKGEMCVLKKVGAFTLPLKESNHDYSRDLLDVNVQFEHCPKDVDLFKYPVFPKLKLLL